MDLLKVADVPATTVAKNATVIEAINAMVKNRVGAVAIVEQGLLKGIFTERDVMIRVVQARRNPEATRMSEVMTTPVQTIPANTSIDDALATMLEQHIRHLPITDANGRILGMLSIRNLLQRRVEDLSHELEAVDAYLTADGIGG
ncbi:MAG: CBS domain-containing protein [candidate division KSB1 bacterium]|nr:CBS domain-containing protein [candidate division KSB1 bacterium]MDZ7367542.1 CBS domain-containing protein [candidate division KSB1 bacterium]MDZ7404900.1 CBS domain-containing protein [candidate division KSB1 bacterium]